jgi:hypothetical protein
MALTTWLQIPFILLVARRAAVYVERLTADRRHAPGNSSSCLAGGLNLGTKSLMSRDAMVSSVHCVVCLIG